MKMGEVTFDKIFNQKLGECQCTKYHVKLILQEGEFPRQIISKNILIINCCHLVLSMKLDKCISLCLNEI
jgi:hypothetical protein